MATLVLVALVAVPLSVLLYVAVLVLVVLYAEHARGMAP